MHFLFFCTILEAENWKEVMFVQFVPFVLDTNNKEVPVEVEEMTIEDAQRTNEEPVWQTSWTSTYIQESRTERYAVKRDEELIALGAYEISENALLVHIVYMEAHPASNPTLDGGKPKYRGIGRLLIAQGIKLSIDNGLGGNVVLEAKTSELAAHYERDFGAIRLPGLANAAPRYLIADEAAKRIFFTYLK